MLTRSVGLRFTFPSLLILICLSALTVFGQATTGSVSGTAVDPKGAVVAGATVTILNNATGAERSAVSSSSGTFDFQALQPGTYTISVEATGFRKAVAREIQISVGSNSQIEIPMEVGPAGETVTVTTAQEVINTSTPSLTNVVNTRQVVDLPLGGRNPVELASLQAGIAVIGNGTRGASVAGLRQTAVNLTQDGINSMDNFVKTSSFFAITTPSLNSTAEFSITTGTVGSDAGRGAAQVNLVTKGGTNDFHGGGFLQLINESYNANTFFNNFNGTARPILRQHFYGFDIGGPVYAPAFGEGGPAIWSGKDKAFFFYSYEAFRQNQGRANNRNGVLTQEARNGIFRYNRTCPAQPTSCVPGVETVPLLTIGNVHTLNPIMTAHLAQIPLPNNFNCSNSDGFNIGCFTFNVSETNSNDKHVVRYDHQLVRDTRIGSHKVEFVYSRVVTSTHPDVFTNGLDAPFPGGVHGFQASTRNLVTPALVSTFGSNWTNVLRYGRQWAPVDFNRDTMPTEPFISLAGVLVNYDNTFMPQPRNTIVHQVTDTLSWVNGNHLWKFGADWQNVLGISRNDAGINKQINLGTNAANGAGFTQSNLPFSTTANLTAATTTYTTIVGNLASATQTFNVTSPDSGFVQGATRLRQVQEKDLALFASDQWRMKSNLTFTYGVRWDYMGVPTVPNGLAIQPQYKDIYGISGFGNLFTPTAAPGSQTQPGATLDFVSGETGKGLYKNDWNNFAPSLGLAWSPSFKSGFLHKLFGDEGTSSIRGGYSISYLHDGVTTFTNLLGTGTTNPGLIATANLSPLGGNPPSNNLLGVLGPGGVPLVTPVFKMPITDRENFLANSANGLWTADPNLRSPFVHQYSFGIEREIFKDTALEIRYQGNFSSNTWRAFDINEVNIFENGFLTEFLGAQNNLNLYLAAFPNCGTSGAAGNPCRFGNSGLAGQVTLPRLSAFFNGLSATSSNGFASSTFIANLQANNVGTMASTLAFNSLYRTNRETAALGIPANFFVANPNATFARVLTNDSRSNYNALEVEIRRRFSSGLQFQADYTFSKAMGDAVDAQGNNQSDLVNRLTLRNPGLDYRRSTEDQTHRFVANGIYELPFGNGKRFLNSSNPFMSRVAGGWSLGAIVVYSTSPPFFISAGRATFNSATANNGAQLVGITFEEFKKNLGLFFDKGGVFFVNPQILDITYNSSGKVATSKLKPGLMSAPAPGTFGNFPVNSLVGPNYFNFDLSVTKRIPITETVRFEFKVTAINILNHPNFVFGSQNFDSTTFGLVTTQRGTARNINFIGQLRF